MVLEEGGVMGLVFLRGGIVFLHDRHRHRHHDYYCCYYYFFFFLLIN